MFKAIGNGLAAIPRGLNVLLELKNEATGTRKVTIAAVLMITTALAGLSISGAFANSEGNGLAWIPRVFYALLVLGLETLAAVLFMRAMLAGKTFRAAVCFAAMPFLIWANVQNCKDGVHFIFPTRFAESGQTLNEKAELAKEEAAVLGAAATAALASSGTELERVRTQIADQEAFLFKMSAMTPEGIKEAQSEMIGRCGYQGRVDGIRSVLTESAMRTCGERINRQLDVLRQRENNLLSGVATPQQDATTDKRLEEIEIRAAARKAAAAESRLEVILWISELARNLMLWAAATTATAALLSRARERDEEIAEAEHAARLAAIRGADEPAAPPAPEPPAETPLEPVEAVAEPEPPPPAPEPPPPPEPAETRDTQHFRDMAKQAHLNRQAEKARNSRLIVIGPVSTLDAMKVAAE